MILMTHALLTQLRHWRLFRRLIDPQVLLLIRDGVVDRRNLQRCGMTAADLDAALRQHGYATAAEVSLAVSEARGGVSVLTRPDLDPGEGLSYRRFAGTVDAASSRSLPMITSSSARCGWTVLRFSPPHWSGRDPWSWRPPVS